MTNFRQLYDAPTAAYLSLARPSIHRECAADPRLRANRPPDADAGALYDSIKQRLMVRPGDTLVHPGHDDQGRTVSTIAEEREHNPCVASRSRDEFISQRVNG